MKHKFLGRLVGILITLICFSFIILTACGSSSTPTPPASTYTIGGTVSGLSGTVVLQNNLADDLSITADGTFTFATAMADGAAYSVTVLTQPGTQTCTVANGSGTISGANVTNVTVTCATNTYTVGGTISGLSGTVVLQNNLADDLSIAADGTFTFTTAIADGAAYSVTVLTQPSGQTCLLTNHEGTVSGANVTNVNVTCRNSVLKIFFAALQPNGDLGGVSGADAVCESSKLDSATYKAMVVTTADAVPARVACTTADCSGGTSEHTDWVLYPEWTYVRAADETKTITITNSNGLFTFALTNSITDDMVSPAWTGLNTNWTTNSTNNCTNWTSSAGGVSGYSGRGAATDVEAIYKVQATVTCDSATQHLYCVEQ